jgi:hypothetical protein
MKNLSSFVKTFSLILIAHTLTNCSKTSTKESISVNNQSSINSNNNLSSSEKLGLLSGCSIGRYSASYWANYIFSLSGGVTAQKITNSPLKFSLTRWMKVVLCDIGGAIAGIPGHLPGIICGAIGGSITGYATT